ncbi:sensor histidine kinase [Agathobaculum sp.]|uniref:sensor histidine kinase n=1 Tax=Agathobaculum sp. TaxID=2048138 RepID=UPI0039A275DB
MIKKLRIKLILVSMLSLLAVLLAIVGGINLMNVHRMIGEADSVLDILAENDGRLPMQEEFAEPENGPEYASPEVPYESRYFYVLLDEEAGVIATNIEKIAAVDQETAEEYAQAALDSGADRGFVGGYRYTVQEEESGIRISFLDCGRRIGMCRVFALNSLWISLLGMLAVFLLMMLASGRIIKPVSDSYEKQKQFITDAGHEIKTPLAIIDADAGLIEMENGPNEWLRDIQTQVRRLTGLTNDLIYLARTEEAQGRQEMLDFPLSDMMEEQICSFQALAIQNNRKFVSHIQPMLTLHGDEKMISQLVSILLDNAVKYSDAGGEIRVMLEKQGRTVHLSVFNTVESISQQELEHLFDRFYRTDRSRNSKTGGYGIGLSIASAVAAAHKGKILASSRDGHSLLITVILPA